MANYLALDSNGIIRAISNHPFESKNHTIIKTDQLVTIGTSYRKQTKLKIAFVSNFKDQCGISTYSEYLIEKLVSKVEDVKVFLDWECGQSMSNCVDQILAYKPDLIITQYALSLFSNHPNFLKYMQGLDHIPHLVTVHSVYEGQDISSLAAMKNIIVHTKKCEELLVRQGVTGKIFQIPHGCIEFNEKSTNNHSLIQFGFGFKYKGVENALKAVQILKNEYPDIFYYYLCSKNERTKLITMDYYNKLTEMIKELDISENVAIVRKYQSFPELTNYFQNANIAVFPYLNDNVYGASGAIRIAMSAMPVIGSNSALFDELDIPKPDDLSEEIKKIFEDEKYRQQLMAKNKKYIEQNNWDITADRYLNLYQNLRL